MPRHHHNQSLSRGFSILELMVAVLLMGVASLLAARMVSALVKGARHTVRQSAALAAGRKALLNVGGNRGLVWAAQEASSARSLSASTLQLVVQGPVNADFAVLGSSVLVKTEGGLAFKQAADISSMTVSYFEIGSNGLIFQSTKAAQASFVQVVVEVKGKTSKDRTYKVVSGAWLRNQ